MQHSISHFVCVALTSLSLSFVLPNEPSALRSRLYNCMSRSHMAYVRLVHTWPRSALVRYQPVIMTHFVSWSVGVTSRRPGDPAVTELRREDATRPDRQVTSHRRDLQVTCSCGDTRPHWRGRSPVIAWHRGGDSTFYRTAYRSVLWSLLWSLICGGSFWPSLGADVTT